MGLLYIGEKLPRSRDRGRLLESRHSSQSAEARWKPAQMVVRSNGVETVFADVLIAGPPVGLSLQPRVEVSQDFLILSRNRS